MYFFLQVVNHHLLRDLTESGLWSEEMKNDLLAHNGSIQVLFITCSTFDEKIFVLIVNCFNTEIEYQRNPERHQGIVQDGLGNFTAHRYSNGC